MSRSAASAWLIAGRRDRAAIHRAEPVRAGFLVADRSASQVKLRAVAVLPRRRRNQVDLLRRFQLADPPEHFPQNLPLLRQLEIVGGVLVVASAATPEVGARRLDALAGRRRRPPPVSLRAGPASPARLRRARPRRAERRAPALPGRPSVPGRGLRRPISRSSLRGGSPRRGLSQAAASRRIETSPLLA